MNYRHIYHAGNFVDVFKHSILVMLLQALLQKDKPITYLDTHAGIGSYDLTSVDAQKTGEFKDGIRRLYNLDKNFPLPLVIDKYIEIVKSMNDKGQATKATYPAVYPGSPYIAQHMLRPQDAMILVELHPEDIVTLKREFRRDSRVAVHNMDGYQSLKAFLPPKQGRGLVLIDPPYEERDEWQKIVAAVEEALKRFPIGVFAIWYPIKDRQIVQDFYKNLAQLDAKNILISDIKVDSYNKTITDKNGIMRNVLTSCGLAIINAPWQFSEQLNPLVSWLSKHLAIDQGEAQATVKWLLEEK